MRRRYSVLALGLLLWVLFPTAGIGAQGGSLDGGVHIVQPGETLWAIAERYGLEANALLAWNDLPDPRAVYPGQRLHWLRPVETGAKGQARYTWSRHQVSFGEDWLTLSQQAGMPWRILAKANRQLQPLLWVGQSVYLPTSTSLKPMGIMRTEEPLLLIALRHGVSVWSLRAGTPYPPYTGALILGAGTRAMDLPYPLARLDLSSQPVMQGETMVLVLETVVPVTCEVTYVDKVEACFGDETLNSVEAYRRYALIGLPALLEPGLYEIGLQVRAEDGDGQSVSEVGLSLPLWVAAGRFSFERIDLPPSRQGLSSSELAQVERVKIAEAMVLRSPERHWGLPFDFPLQAEVSSYFGSRRSYGGTTFNTYHAGVDLNANEGTPVQAPAAGVVVLAETFAVRGKVVVIDHGWGVLSGYWHLSHIEAVVGQEVARGQVIGRVGNTGSSTGPHLHWEMWVNGVAVDPLQWVEPFSVPIEEGE